LEQLLCPARSGSLSIEILTPFQHQFLSRLAGSPLQSDFFFTGGTALAAFYLHHRYSEDLDFFTDDPQAVSRVAPVIQQLAKELGMTASFTRTTGHFLECFLANPSGERLEMDFALDSPYRLEAKVQRPEIGLWVDGPLDIACNKLSALYDRADPKDFVDIYFIHEELFPLEELLPKAQQKHVGLDNYWLAQAFSRVTEVKILPRLIKPVTHDQLVKFFTGKIPWLMHG
jgi:predicted nucleotidyltransferase component of viral defense system